MSSGCLDASARNATGRWGAHLGTLAFAAAAILAAAISPTSARELKVCADPNNLPFSNAKEQGFENRIVDLLAMELDAQVSYVWWAQRRGFVRNTLKAGLCDLIPGTPASMEMLRTTAPYYRSTYVFVTRAGGPDISSFDDPQLRKLKVGVQLIGDDGANSPPVQALARRGIVGNLQGFPVYGDYSTPNPPARIIDAVANGDIDVAVAWGPLAGYFAPQQPAKLRVTAVSPRIDGPLPMAYDISMGVRREDEALRSAIDDALTKHRAEINKILADYGVPRLDSDQVTDRP